jgi:pimeloyl-ACP methyl ester carboxylesterase
LTNLTQGGRSVQTPLLLSSGEDWEDFNEDNWEMWLLEAENALEEISSHCENVFVAGLATAGSLALRIAQKHGEKLDGIILLDPILPNQNRKLKRVKKDLEDQLYFIDQPLLLVYSSRAEITVNPHAETISSAVSSPIIREIVLENPFEELSLVSGEIETFIAEVVHGFWNRDLAGDDSDLIDAEFDAIVAGLSLDESSPSNYLDDLDRPDPDEHFTPPDPYIHPIANRGRRSAIFAMIVGPIYALSAAFAGFNPFGIEPWPGIIAAIGGLGYFFYTLQDDEPEDDGAIL